LYGSNDAMTVVEVFLELSEFTVDIKVIFSLIGTKHATPAMSSSPMLYRVTWQSLSPVV
jgi:hypothetical protein